MEFLTTLCHGIGGCIINAYLALVDELLEHKILKATITFNQPKADALFENTLKYTESWEEKVENIVKCIEYYPGERRFYDEIMDEIKTCDRGTEFTRFLSFWKLNFLYPNYEDERRQEKELIKENEELIQEEKRKAEEFDEYIEKVIDELNDLETVGQKYGKLRRALSDFFDEHEINDIPKESIYIQTIKDFFASVNFKNRDAVLRNRWVIEWIPMECSTEEFMLYLDEERSHIWSLPLNDYWMIGDYGTDKAPTEDILNKVKRDNDTLLLYHDTSLLGNGKRGIMITTRYIADLKEGTKINIKDVKEINLFDNGVIEIKDEQKAIKWRDKNFLDLSNLIYMHEFLEIFCVRYGKNAALWDENMITPKPENVCRNCGYSMDFDMAFCPMCGEENPWL